MIDPTTTPTAGTDLTALVDTYFELWNEGDPTRRAELVGRVWTPDGRHVDPLADVAGHAALGELVGGVRAQFPGHRLSRVTSVDAHHDQLRYGWELTAPDGAVVVSAVDVAEVAPDGRLRQVAASFGELAAAG